MAWNGSDQGKAKVEGQGQEKVERRGLNTPRSSLKHGVFAGAIVIALGCGAIWWFVGSGDDNQLPTTNQPTTNRTIAEVKPDIATNKTAATTNANAQALSEEATKVLNERVKDFIKKPANTNDIKYITRALDPDDPDNVLYAGVTQELTSLLSIEPGDEIPPFPYSFMIEDIEREEAATSDEAAKVDNGNKAFLETLKKWKITAKETDSDDRIAHKERLLQAQSDLLEGMDQGMSVNDSIRAAYEFRKRAFEMRNTIVQTLTECYEKDSDRASTVAQIDDMNKLLAEEGIRQIPYLEVMEDYEDNNETETTEEVQP